MSSRQWRCAIEGTIMWRRRPIESFATQEVNMKTRKSFKTWMELDVFLHLGIILLGLLGAAVLYLVRWLTS